ncbi:UDP-N-acetylmuramoyl-tripeptide--D-alanyl-D-alanine ligase [Marinomonas piezotolerans]|uniref:UDP-N-acetylmuramoyl-tripeptide--D-alanyl-D-alanine ligase n=1 Tax=Marinomonas piezotolerans TaxID=2213058 RepID=A0A370U5E1_9GAMM|nr:UDP-N-acetylmuramoyl-tripeptide--D-alanyl-D-alanine ligase [Marinomonas piezotolerans]RDL42968.1 UDP-N-acetylmuramoyl-tripeptide--D-alanyl-D-alanine ligase [Marinomonas piezotolerans]
MLGNLQLSDIAKASGGRLVGEDIVVSGVSTDTRENLEGCLFVALTGASFDGHSFITTAFNAGAKAVLVAESSDCEHEPRIEVKDTTRAYGVIGRLIRNRFTYPVVAITGSNGKTSVKDWLAQVLEQNRSVLKTQSNLNNQIGVPKTLLSLEHQHQCAVVEAGTSFPGEIELLGSAIHADIVILTNASGSHLEGFGSIKGIAVEKGKLIETARPNATVILNADDDSYDYWCGLLKGRSLRSFSLVNPNATIFARNIEQSAIGSKTELVFEEEVYELMLDRPGRHHVVNAMAVALALIALGMPFSEVVSELSHPAQVPGRMEQIVTKSKALMINDCYNASPKSVEAAMDVTALFHDKVKWVVLGALGELGDQEVSVHQGLGAYAANVGVDQFISIGPIAQLAAQEFAKRINSASAHYCVTKEEAIALLAALDSNNVILVKGSRSAKMEDIVNALKN